MATFVKAATEAAAAVAAALLALAATLLLFAKDWHRFDAAPGSGCYSTLLADCRSPQPAILCLLVLLTRPQHANDAVGHGHLFLSAPHPHHQFP